MKKLIMFVLLSSFFVSCNETEATIYDSVNGQSLVYFGVETSNLAIEIGGAGQVVIPINVSTKSTEDRTVTVELLAVSTADPANYSYSPTVVIPAGEYSADLVISGTDITAETTPETLVFKLASFSDATAILGSKNHEVSVFQFCPIPVDKFVGNYLIEETTPFVDGPTLSNNTVVAVQFVSQTQRKFSTKNYPNYCAPFMTFNFSLVCNEVIVPNGQRSTFACTSAGLFFGPATTPSTYDVSNDNIFYITFANDNTGDCNAVFQTTYKFTKQ